MHPDEYKTQALATESKLDSLVLSASESRVLHGAMGLVTESAELTKAIFDHLINETPLDIANIGEEIGDSFWYLAVLFDCFNKNLHQDILFATNLSMISKIYRSSHIKVYGMGLEVVDLSRLVVVNSADILDILKKKYFYKSTKKEDKIPELLDSQVYFLLELCISLRLQIEPILIRNIEKLKARYPNGFNADNAENRNLDGERKILEAD